MKAIKALIPALLLAFFVAACGNEAAEVEAPADASTAQQPEQAPGETIGGTAARKLEAEAPRLIDGVQVVEVRAGKLGYEPKRIALKAGVPARLVFTRTVDAGCSEDVTIPGLGVEKTKLPLNEPVAIEFTPEEGGDYTFVCGMDMQEGTLVVHS